MQESTEQYPSAVWGLFMPPLYALIAQPELYAHDTNISTTTSVVKAYKIACDLERPLDEELLIAINNAITDGVKETLPLDPNHCGDFRTSPVNYKLFAQDTPVNCLTSEGLEQLIDTWFTHSSAPTDYIHFKGQDQKNSDCYVQPQFHQKPNSLTDENNKLTIPVLEIRKPGSPTELQMLVEQTEKVYSLSANMAKSSSGRVCHFNPVCDLAMKLWYADANNITLTNAVISLTPRNAPFTLKESQELLKPLPEKISTKDVIRFKMAEISEDYQQKITDAKNSDEKLRVIVATVQKIAQLHPFRYSMFITCEVLLNRLLHQHKLPMTILMYSKRLCGYSLDQAVNEVKSGQQVFLDALCGKNSVTFHDTVRNEKKQCYTKMPVGGLTKSENDSLLTTVCLANVHRAFPQTDLAKKAILSVFSAVSPEQALRRAAATGNHTAAHIILDYDVDINGQDEKKKRTALHWAVIRNDTKITELLMSHGAQIDISDNEGKTCLDLASNDEITLLLTSRNSAGIGR